MDRVLTVVLFSGVLMAQSATSVARAAQSTSPRFALEDGNAVLTPAAIPVVPQGKSTMMGGEIQKLDPVRDQFQLKAFGQRPMAILFDERTQVFLDGKKVRLRELRSDSIASIQTVLDGTSVFAISIHLQSRAPEGEFQGQVLNYNPDTRELTVSGVSSRDPFRLIVPMGIPISRSGQGDFQLAHSESSELAKGALITLTFAPDEKGRGIVKQIEILAMPGSAFVFGGSLSALDMHLGMMTLVDPRDEKSYQIAFDPSKFPATRTLHEGDSVRVTATYDGSQYVANSISSN